MQGYSYVRVTNAWVCKKCSALVDDPSLHEDSHRELVDVLGRWSSLLERAVPAESDVTDASVPAVVYGSPSPVPADSAGGPGDPLDRALEATAYTTLGRGDLVGDISDKRIGER